MDISGNNIDKWFFDYFEGNLSQGQTEDFNQFLIDHPWHAEEFEIWKQTYQAPHDPKYTFDNKSTLIKKTPFNEYLKYAALALLLFSMGGVSTYFFMSNTASLEQKSASTISLQVENLKLDKILNEEPYKKGDNSSSSVEESITDENAKSVDVYTDFVENQESKDNEEPINTVNGHQDEMVNTISSTTSNANQIQATNVNSSANSKLETDYSSTLDKIKDQSTDFNLEKTFHLNLIKSLTPEMPTEHLSLQQNISKITNEGLAPNYIENPVFVPTEVELEFAKSGYKRSSKLKKLSKKIIRMLDDPIALTNLRDPNLIVPQYNPLVFNSSFAGSMYRGRWENMHRYQWHNSSNVTHHSVMSYDAYVSAIKGGVGIVASFSDFSQSMYQDYQVSMIYSPKFRISRNVSFEPSVKFTSGMITLNHDKFNGQSIEWNRGNVMSTFSNSDAITGSKLMYRDIGVGSLLNTKWFFAGFNIDNVLNHQQNIYNNDEAGQNYRAPRMINAVIGTDYQSFANPDLVVSPHLTYTQIGDRSEAWLGSHFRWNWFLMGASASNRLDYKGMIGFQKNAVRLTYSYDQTYSWLANQSLPSHELNLKVLIGKTHYRAPNKRY